MWRPTCCTWATSCSTADGRGSRAAPGRSIVTPTEFRLLVFLAQHPGQAFTRGQLMENVWGHTADYYDEKTVNVHIRRLREKIEVEPSSPKLSQTSSALDTVCAWALEHHLGRARAIRVPR